MIEGPTPCPACSTPVWADQSFCVGCGHRAHDRSQRVFALGWPVTAEAGGQPLTRRRRPVPWSAGLVAAALAVGTFVGAEAGPSTDPVLASARGAYTIVLHGRPATVVPASSLPDEYRADVASAASNGGPGGSGGGGPGDAGGGPTSAPPPASAPPPPDTTPPAVDTPPPSTAPPAPPPTPAPPAPPTFSHVWVVVLADQGFESLYGATSAATYLHDTLLPQGELLANLHATTHGHLAPAVALVSGQGPTPETQADCPVYTDLRPGTVDPDSGQAAGRGCVYPKPIQTLGDQLVEARLTWKAYVEDQERGAPLAPSSCRRPAAIVPGAPVPQSPTDGYVAARNPFVFFRSVRDSDACATTDVALESLAGDLSSGHVPAFSYIVPSRCHAGFAEPCVPGEASGAAAADAFLKTWIPRILASPAYGRNSLVVIVSDQAPATGDGADDSRCCARAREPFPNAPDAKGGGRVGALLLSPRVRGGATARMALDDFDLLRSFEDSFLLPYLGYATDAQGLPASLFMSPSKSR